MKDFKAAGIKMLQRTIRNTLETSEKLGLGREIEAITKTQMKLNS